MINRKYCAGCYNDHYNEPGNSTNGRCWSRDDAQLVKRLIISVDARPPHDKTKAERVPNCYHAQRFVTVDPDAALTADGYWR